MPVNIPGGNPTIAVPGHTPTSPLTFVGAATVEVLVTVEPAKIPKPQPAAPIGMGPGQATAAVVNIQLKSAASAMPNWSCAPVVIVAVYGVLSARRFEGVKVATVSVASRATVPMTAVPPVANLKVPVLIVEGFIALLKVAVTTAPWQMPVAAPAGTTETTVGGVVGEVGPPAVLSGSPQPANAAVKRNAGIQILPTFDLRISFSS
jgi:hypothetical protein